MLRNKKPARRNIGIEIDPKIIKKWQLESIDICELITGDAVEYLQSFQFSGSELVYADPPYLIQTRKQPHIYTYEYSTQEHEKLLSTLKALPCMAIISGYESELYNDTLQGWQKQTFLAKTHTDVRQESVWFNFDRPNKLHDSRFLGASFRERQTIKRRQQRMQEKFRQMEPIERCEIIQWLNETYSERG